MGKFFERPMKALSAAAMSAALGACATTGPYKTQLNGNTAQCSSTTLQGEIACWSIMERLITVQGERASRLAAYTSIIDAAGQHGVLDQSNPDSGWFATGMLYTIVNEDPQTQSTLFERLEQMGYSREVLEATAGDLGVEKMQFAHRFIPAMHDRMTVLQNPQSTAMQQRESILGLMSMLVNAIDTNEGVLDVMDVAGALYNVDMHEIARNYGLDNPQRLRNAMTTDPIPRVQMENLSPDQS